MAIHKILIIDDEPEVRECVKLLLERDKNYQCDEAGNGTEGLRMILAGHYDCLVSDIKMPGLDGVSMLKELRAAGLDTPIVFISAFADANFDREVTGYGAVKLIHKLELRGIGGRVAQAISIGKDSQAIKDGKDPMGDDFLQMLNNKSA